MTEKLKVLLHEGETPTQAVARLALTPECLSASVLIDSRTVAGLEITAVMEELQRQTAALNSGDLTRAEDMLLAQAHTLDGLFAQLASQAMRSQQRDGLESYMRLALKAQNQARTTLQTLGELKAPKQVAFVQQANIGNQVQINNGKIQQPAHTRKTKKKQNELLEAEHGERLDTRAAGAAGRADPTMATLEAEHRAEKPGRQGRGRS